jgi:hypothetical protein
MKPHKHAELIKAWADGAEIEYESHGIWVDEAYPDWYPEMQYRIKPEQKPDKWSYLLCSKFLWIELSSSPKNKHLWKDVIRLKRDGETGKIKSAEVLK